MTRILKAVEPAPAATSAAAPSVALETASEATPKPSSTA
jgi:hypothetical protein